MSSHEVSVASQEPLVEQLLKRDGRKKNWLAEQLGMARTTLDSRISGNTPWTLVEALRLADIFRVPVESFAPSEAA